MSIQKQGPAALEEKETINVSKLIYAAETQVRFQRKETSFPFLPEANQTFTASASPNVYYISLAETTEVLMANPKKE